MNILRPIASGRSRFCRRPCRAFTITELMVASAIFSLVVVAITSVQMFGMRMYQVSETKLSATAGARKALNQIRGDILGGKVLRIQNGNQLSHPNVANNSPQIGNAIEIRATGSDTNYVLYFMDVTNKCLKRFSNSDKSIEIMAKNVTNQIAFRAEDFQGNTLTTNQNQRVINLLLEFNQRAFPMGGGEMYDSYRLQTRITQRMSGL